MGARMTPELSDEIIYELSEAFDSFDIDGNGSITISEMQQETSIKQLIKSCSLI